MSEMEYGSDEHLDGLSRDALKAEVRWWHGRALEMEDENAKMQEDLLDAEHEESRAWDRVRAAERRNDELRELVRIMHGELVSCEDNGYVCGGHKFDERVRELGVDA